MNTLKQALSKTILVCAAIVASIVASELFLRTINPFELHYGTWFSRGAQQPDENFGVVYTPNFNGAMYHPDGAYNIPLHLDKYGFRKPAGSANPNAAKVVILGGMSMVFSYGLVDQNALHARIAEHAAHQLTIYNTAWPGLPPYYNYLIYNRTLAKEIAPRLIVLCVYTISNNVDADDSFKNPDDWSDQLRPKSKEELSDIFSVFPDIQAKTSKIITWLKLTKAYSRLYTLTAISNLFNEIDTLINKTTNFIQIALVSEPQKTGVNNFISFIAHLKMEATKTDSKLTVIFLPRVGESESLYHPFMETLPTDVTGLDLHRRFVTQFTEENLYIAAHHYNRKASDLLGQAIAHHIDGLLTQK